MKRIKIKWLCFIILQSYLSVFSQQSVTLENDWQFLKSDLGGVWEALRPVKKGSSQAVPLWEEVKVPHCFNAKDAVKPDLNYYQGPGWYRKELQLKNDSNRILLHFEGAGQKTEVYIHSEKVGEHVGGYDEWTVDITDAVKRFRAGNYKSEFNNRVPLLVRCDNSRDLEMIPSDLSDFNIYGGLYRAVNLIYKPENYIKNVSINSDVNLTTNKAQISLNVNLRLKQAGQKGTIQFKLYSPDGTLVVDTKKEITALSEIYNLTDTTINNPKLWSPNTPNLYRSEVVFSTSEGTDIIAQNIGFRSFEFIKKGPFKLNGKRLLLRGTHRHEDHAGTAAAMTKDLMTKEMTMMKKMGINFIRLGHYQQNRHILNLCDRLGILVWEEIPWCRGGLGGEIYKSQAKRMLKNMITQHKNHPSVIIWGLGNENDWPGDFTTFDKSEIRAFMNVLNDLAHKLDPSRKTAIRRCDFCKDIVDVYSPSIWAGWYRGKFTNYKSVSKMEMEKVDHFLHVEWGASNHARRHSENPDKHIAHISGDNSADEREGDASLYGGSARVSKDGDWTETYACNLIDWHLKEQENMPWLTGTAYWPFKDFSTPVRPENPVPYVNQKGVVERDLTKKEAFYVFQSYWTEKPMVHIYGHTWPVRWGDKNEKKLIKVYSNCPEVELIVNGKNYGIKKRNSQNYPAAGQRWEVLLAEGQNEIKAIGRKGGIEIVDEITVEYQTKKWNTPTKLTLDLKKVSGDTVWLQAQAYDVNKVKCLDAKNRVSFNISGDGQLIVDQGTSRGSSKLQLYNGRAIIGVLHNNGKSVVSVKSEGLETGFKTIGTEEDLDNMSSVSKKFDASKILSKLVNKYKKLLNTNKIDSISIPRTADGYGVLKGVKSKDWTSGFFPGIIWYLYEFSKDDNLKSKAETITAFIEKEKYNGKTHDMGFKIGCSFGNGYKLTNSEAYRKVIIKSAETLITRFNPKVGCIRSWDHNSDKWDFPVIIDNMMNLELLFNAYQLTGNKKFYDIAVSHADVTMKNHFRKDNSSYHVIGYNPKNGKVVKKNTHQGYSDSSIWARGQAWGLYGYTLLYRETKDRKYLKQAEKIASLMLNHANMPSDYIPFWDFLAPNIPDEPRDVSAACIMASALLELSTYGNDSTYKSYSKIATKVLGNLSSEAYTERNSEYFVLNQSTGSFPNNSEINVPLVYADYYYVEALLRSLKYNSKNKL